MDDEEALVDDGKKNEGSSSMATEHDQGNTCREAQKKDSVEESDSQTSKSSELPVPEDDIHEEIESDDEKNQDSVPPHSQVTESQRELQSRVEENDSEEAYDSENGYSEALRILFRSSSSENGYSEEGYEPDNDSVPQSQESPRGEGQFRVEENVGESSKVSDLMRVFFSGSSSDDGIISSEDGYGTDQKPFKQEIERILKDKWFSVQEKCLKEGTSDDFQRVWDNHSRFARRLRRGQIPLEYYLREPQGTSQEEEGYDKNKTLIGSSKNKFLEKFTSVMELRMQGRQSDSEVEGIEMTDLSKADLVVDRIEYVEEQVSPSSDTDEGWKFAKSSLAKKDKCVHYAQQYLTFYVASDENTFGIVIHSSDGLWTNEDERHGGYGAESLQHIS